MESFNQAPLLSTELKTVAPTLINRTCRSPQALLVALQDTVKIKHRSKAQRRVPPSLPSPAGTVPPPWEFPNLDLKAPPPPTNRVGIQAGHNQIRGTTNQHFQVGINRTPPLQLNLKLKLETHFTQAALVPFGCQSTKATRLLWRRLSTLSMTPYREQCSLLGRNGLPQRTSAFKL
jgi:hypothetical protein